MKVKATRMGYMFHRRIRPGEVFELPNPNLFSDAWMISLDEKRPAKGNTRGKKAKPEDVEDAVDANEEPQAPNDACVI